MNGLGVVRSLGQEGIPVLGLYLHAHEAGRFSRYCRSTRLPEPGNDPGRTLDVLLQAARGLERPPLFPTTDQFLELVSENRHVLEGSYRFQIPDAAILRMMLEKNGTWTLAERYGVPIPTTRYPRSAADVAAVGRDLRFPCIVKPVDTFSVPFPGRAKNIIAEGPRDLDEFFRAHPGLLGQVVVQEVIRSGDGHIYVCAAYFDARSEARAVYTGRKIRQYPPDYGVTCYGESVYVPAIEEITVRFLRSVGFRGLVAAEFARDQDTGEYLLLEVNARSFYHNRLFTDCGINLAHVAYQDLLGNPLPARAPRQREGVLWLDFQRDLSSFWRKRRQGVLTWREWWRSLWAARSFAYFDRSDLKPFAFSLLLLLGSLVSFATRPFRPRAVEAP